MNKGSVQFDPPPESNTRRPTNSGEMFVWLLRTNRITKAKNDQLFIVNINLSLVVWPRVTNSWNRVESMCLGHKIVEHVQVGQTQAHWYGLFKEPLVLERLSDTRRSAINSTRPDSLNRSERSVINCRVERDQTPSKEQDISSPAGVSFFYDWTSSPRSR